MERCKDCKWIRFLKHRIIYSQWRCRVGLFNYINPESMQVEHECIGYEPKWYIRFLNWSRRLK